MDRVENLHRMKRKRPSDIPAAALPWQPAWKEVERGKREGLGRAELAKNPCWGAEGLEVVRSQGKDSHGRGWEGDDLKVPLQPKPCCDSMLKKPPKQSQAGSHSTWGCGIFPAVAQGMKWMEPRE